jgi:hypothetical protein
VSYAQLVGRLSTVVRRVVVRGLSAAAWVVLLGLERRPLPRIGATDRRVFQVNEHVQVRVMWIDRPGEVGPSWSAFGGRHELVRVDMFLGAAHMHPMMGILLAFNAAGERWFFAAGTLEESAAAGVDECRRNLGFHVACHPWRRLRRAVPSQAQQVAAAEWLSGEVADLIARHAR